MINALTLIPIAIVAMRGGRRTLEHWDFSQFKNKKTVKREKLIVQGELQLDYVNHVVAFGTSGSLARPLLGTIKAFGLPVIPVSRGEINEYPEANRSKHWVSAGKERDLDTTRKLSQYEYLLKSHTPFAAVLLVNMTRGPIAPYRPFDGQNEEQLRKMEGVIPPDTGEQIFENTAALQELIFGKDNLPPQLRIAIINRSATFGSYVDGKPKPAFVLFREKIDLPTYVITPEDLIDREIVRIANAELNLQNVCPYVHVIGDSRTDAITKENLEYSLIDLGINNISYVFDKDTNVIVVAGVNDQQVESEVQQIQEELENLNREIPIIAILKRPDEGNLQGKVGKNLQIVPVQSLVAEEVKRIMGDNHIGQEQTTDFQSLTEIARDNKLAAHFKKIQDQEITTA